MENQNAAEHSSQFWDLLGGVRFALAAIVLTAHLTMHTTGSTLGKTGFALSAPTAVLCFLILSGYSIAHSISRSSEGFYKRRILRIYPIYFLGILLGIVVARLPGATTWVSPHNVIANLLFLQTFVAFPLLANGVVWSLAVEVGFYALAPVLQKMSTPILLVMTAISATAFAISPYMGLKTYYGCLPHGEAMFLLGWAWLAGFAYYRYRQSQGAGVLLLVTVISVTSINTIFTGNLQHITVIVAIGLLVAGNALPINRPVSALLRHLGNLSFPLYLIHHPIYMLCTDTLHCRSPLLMVTAALLASWLGLCVDKPLRSMCAKLFDACESIGSSALVFGRAAVYRSARAVGNLSPLRSLSANRLNPSSLLRPISIVLALLGFSSLAMRHSTDSVSAMVSIRPEFPVNRMTGL